MQLGVHIVSDCSEEKEREENNFCSCCTVRLDSQYLACEKFFFSKLGTHSATLAPVHPHPTLFLLPTVLNLSPLCWTRSTTKVPSGWAAYKHPLTASPATRTVTLHPHSHPPLHLHYNPPPACSTFTHTLTRHPYSHPPPALSPATRTLTRLPHSHPPPACSPATHTYPPPTLSQATHTLTSHLHSPATCNHTSLPHSHPSPALSSTANTTHIPVLSPATHTLIHHPESWPLQTPISLASLSSLAQNSKSLHYYCRQPSVTRAI